ncbi:MAG: UMP kinase [Thermoplasmata archaeon]|nr:UMP kinase [Thermoplasmata archaeon]MCI4359732.1 UMP kinase [Thermoplasmata archaeon]
MTPSTEPLTGTVALSVGGSVLTTGSDDAEYLGRLADLLKKRGREFPLVVTTGGGRTARDYIRLGRALGLTEVELDEVGIDVTRLHARLLAARIGAPTPATPPTTVAEAVRELRHVSPVILGGTEPGHTTDGVAALLAVRLRAVRVVNATRVDGLFDADPKQHPEAKRIDRLGFEEFRRIVQRGSSGEAGQEFLFDRLAADVLSRAAIPVSILDGRDLDNLDAALLGRRFRGTSVGTPTTDRRG